MIASCDSYVLSEEEEQKVLENWKKFWKRHSKNKVFKNEDEEIEAEFFSYSSYYFKFMDSLKENKNVKKH